MSNTLFSMEANYSKVNWTYIEEESLSQINNSNKDNKKYLAYFKYCISLANQGKIDKAYKQLEMIQDDISNKEFNLIIKPELDKLENNPDNILLLNYSAFTAIINNDYQEAIKYFDKILVQESKNIWILNYKAMAYIEIEEYNKAEEICKQAIKIKDNQYSHLILGLNYYQRGEILKALSEFSKSGSLVRKILF